MYLTRFEINKARRGAQKLLGSPQAMHAAVMSAFAAPTPGPDGRVLWRVDGGEVHTRLFIVSPTAPDLTHLVEQAGWPTTETWTTREYSPFLASLQAGQEWGFRLAANPTHSVPGEHGTRGKRLAHVTAEQQRQWLLDRADAMGLDLGEGTEARVNVTGRWLRRFDRRGSQVTVSVAQFDGVGHVVDADRLRSVLRSGIGPAKGYGCGLLTLAPVSGPEPGGGED